MELDPNAVVADEDFDRLFADSAGPYLRLYLTVRLGATGVDEALAEVYASLLASGALIWAGERQGFQTRLYGVVDKVLPHLGKPSLRKPRPPVLEERARRFVELVRERFHGGFDEEARSLRALPEKEREAVLLRSFHEWTMQEIARKLGMPIDEARSFVREAQRRRSSPS